MAGKSPCPSRPSPNAAPAGDPPRRATDPAGKTKIMFSTFHPSAPNGSRFSGAAQRSGAASGGSACWAQPICDQIGIRNAMLVVNSQPKMNHLEYFGLSPSEVQAILLKPRISLAQEDPRLSMRWLLVVLWHNFLLFDVHRAQ